MIDVFTKHQIHLIIKIRATCYYKGTNLRCNETADPQKKISLNSIKQSKCKT